MATFSRIMLVSVLTLPLLVSCGSPSAPASTPASETGSGKTFTIKGSVDSATLEKLDKRASEIDAVNDLNSLSAINPYVLQDPKKDAPKFVEYQKKQMLLGIMSASLRSPEFIEAEKQRASLVEYRAKWPKELVDADAKLKTILADKKNIGPSDEVTKLIKHRQELMRAFQSTREYQDYIKANRMKITQANDAIVKFSTPELQKLQDEVANLRKEVYGK